MAEDVPVGLEPYAYDEDEIVDAGPRPTLGLILAALIAVAASAGFAWWVAKPDASVTPAPAPATEAPPPRAEPAAPLRFAAADPDPSQVRRAWADVQQGYANGGTDALVRASQACARAAPTDPQSLDYCLAYDRYAAAIASGDSADWFADSTARDLTLARTVLPEGVDAGNRLEQVAALTQAVLPKPKPKVVKVVRHVRPHAVKARRQATPVRHANPRPKKARATTADLPPGDAALAARDGQAPPPDVILNRRQVPQLLDPPH
jgi:hypothetical protein